MSKHHKKDDYQEFLKSKQKSFIESGFEIEESELNTNLFPFQKYIVKKALKKGRFAILADCGLGKSLMQLEWSHQVAVKTQKPVLILCPLAVAGQTINEGSKFGIDVYKYDSKCTPCENEPDIFISNYDQLENIDCSVFSGVVLDECFSPDTKIKILDLKNNLQEKYIKDIQIGEKVLNCIGFDTVTEVKRKKIDYAIKIQFNGKEIISSGRHPYFTQRGWVAAKELQSTDFIVSTDKAMRILRGDCKNEMEGGLKEEVLQSILFSEMENVTTGDFSKSTHKRSTRKDRKENIGFFENREGNANRREDSESESDAELRNKEQSICQIETDEPQTFSAWGQWSRNDIASAINEGCTVRELGGGICHITGKTSIGLSNELQSRFSELRAKNCDRSGWELSLQQKSTRQKEGRKTGYFGLESFEVLEQTDTRMDKFRDAEGSLYFYDLSIEQHPSFTINECLVHNSSILKNYNGQTKALIIQKFKHTPYKLACTATPSPNDHIELGNHSEFLNVLRSKEMVSIFFINDAFNKDHTISKWRLKKHAESDFWNWVSSWSIMLSNPSDIGFEGDSYILPSLNISELEIEVSKKDNGKLFNDISVNATDFYKELKVTQEERCIEVAKIVNQSTESFIIWVKTDDEQEEILSLIPDAISVSGKDKNDLKEKRLLGFANNEFRVLVTKAKIAQFGLNFQHCRNQIFLSFDFSFEGLYQAIRRSWRFGQKNEVNVTLVIVETMGNVVNSIKDKQKKFENMQKQMQESMNNVQNEISITDENFRTESGNNFTLVNGDSVKYTKKIETNSIDYTFFSPPFSDLYMFSNDPRDLSNNKSYEDFFYHFEFMIPELLRITKEGRLLSMHCTQLSTSKGRDGFLEIIDFRGDLIRAMQKYGWIFHAEVAIWKDPKIVAQRTKNMQLLHATTKRDSTVNRMGFPDYLLTFKKPGDNLNPVNHDKNGLPFDYWCKIAEPIWLEGEIEAGDVLSVKEAKAEKDEKHMTPTQKEPIKRLLELYTNPNDLVYSPFNGIGTEGYVSIENRRRYLGVELKESYFELSVKNLKNAELKLNQTTLF